MRWHPTNMLVFWDMDNCFKKISALVRYAQVMRNKYHISHFASTNILCGTHSHLCYMIGTMDIGWVFRHKKEKKTVCVTLRWNYLVYVFRQKYVLRPREANILTISSWNQKGYRLDRTKGEETSILEPGRRLAPRWAAYLSVLPGYPTNLATGS